MIYCLSHSGVSMGNCLRFVQHSSRGQLRLFER